MGDPGRLLVLPQPLFPFCPSAAADAAASLAECQCVAAAFRTCCNALVWRAPRVQVEENLGDPLVFTVHAAMVEWLEDYLTELQSSAENAESIARAKAEDERLVRQTDIRRSLRLC